MNYFSFIFQDWKSNKRNSKGRLISLLFRIANYCKGRKAVKIIFAPYLIFYKILVEWVLGIEIPYNVKISPGLTIFHGQSLVINENTVIGNNCIIRHCTTIGNGGKSKICPRIGDNVDIGSNVCIIGPVTIGNNVTIGAGSVVTKDIPAYSTVVGNPARVIKTLLNNDIEVISSFVS